MKHYITPYNFMTPAWARHMFITFLGMAISLVAGCALFLSMFLHSREFPLYAMAILGACVKVAYRLGNALRQSHRLMRQPR